MIAFVAEIGLPPKGLSPNARLHWAAKAKLVKQYREACAWAYAEAKPRGWQAPERAVIDVEYRVHRGAGGYHPKDEDNARAPAKFFCDALKDAGIIRTDAKNSLRWGIFNLITTARECKRLGGAGITVTVRPA